GRLLAVDDHGPPGRDQEPGGGEADPVGRAGDQDRPHAPSNASYRDGSYPTTIRPLCSAYGKAGVPWSSMRSRIWRRRSGSARSSSTVPIGTARREKKSLAQEHQGQVESV